MKNNDHVEITRRLRTEIAGEVYGDVFTRGRYATDASIYQMMPAGTRRWNLSMRTNGQ